MSLRRAGFFTTLGLKVDRVELLDETHNRSAVDSTVVHQVTICPDSRILVMLADDNYDVLLLLQRVEIGREDSDVRSNRFRLLDSGAVWSSQVDFFHALLCRCLPHLLTCDEVHRLLPDLVGTRAAGDEDIEELTTLDVHELSFLVDLVAHLRDVGLPVFLLREVVHRASKHLGADCLLCCEELEHSNKKFFGCDILEKVIKNGHAARSTPSINLRKER